MGDGNFLLLLSSWQICDHVSSTLHTYTAVVNVVQPWLPAFSGLGQACGFPGGLLLFLHACLASSGLVK